MPGLDETFIMRLPNGTVSRAEKLIRVLSKDPRYAAVGKIKKTWVMRLAVLEGLEVLEKKYQPKKPKRAKR